MSDPKQHPYSVFFLPSAKRDFRALDPQMQREYKSFLDAVAADPNSKHGAEPLRSDLKGSLKKRIGKFRLVFNIDHLAQEVVVEVVGNRDDVYEKARRRRS